MTTTLKIDRRHPVALCRVRFCEDGIYGKRTDDGEFYDIELDAVWDCLMNHRQAMKLDSVVMDDGRALSAFWDARGGTLNVVTSSGSKYLSMSLA